MLHLIHTQTCTHACTHTHTHACEISNSVFCTCHSTLSCCYFACDCLLTVSLPSVCSYNTAFKQCIICTLPFTHKQVHTNTHTHTHTHTHTPTQTNTQTAEPWHDGRPHLVVLFLPLIVQCLITFASLRSSELTSYYCRAPGR